MDFKGWTNLVMNVQQSTRLEELNSKVQQDERSMSRLLREHAERDEQKEQMLAEAKAQREKERAEHEKALSQVLQQLKEAKAAARLAKEPSPKRLPARSRGAKGDRRPTRGKASINEQRLMAELLTQNKRAESRLDAIATARQEMFECRKGVEAASPGNSLWATHLAMAHLKERIDTVDMKFLTEISDKKYHDQTAALWAAKYPQLLPGWNEEVQAAAREIFSLLPATCQRIHKLQAIAHDARAPMLTEAPLLPEMAQLEAAISQIGRLVVLIPSADKKSVPELSVLEWARKALILPFHHNLFVFKCAVLVAISDGPLDLAEKTFLNKLAEKMLLTPKEATAFMEQTTAVSKPDFPFTDDEAKVTFKRLCVCAAVDGRVSDEERFALSRIAEVLGIGASDLASVEKEVFPANCGNDRLLTASRAHQPPPLPEGYQS